MGEKKKQYQSRDDCLKDCDKLMAAGGKAPTHCVESCYDGKFGGSVFQPPSFRKVNVEFADLINNQTTRDVTW